MKTPETKPTDPNPPRHWVSLEELNPGYWENAEAQEKRGQEFLHKPIETIAAIDREDSAGINRRDFLTVMGASMAMASFACARRPVHKIIPYVTRPLEVVPGVSTHYASTCGECASACGIVAKNREGRPVKLEGNPDHPVNKGALCARGQASLLNLYDPSRLKGPARVSRKGQEDKLAWGDLDAEVAAKLRAGGKIRVLSRVQSGPAHRRLMQDFLAATPGATWTEYEPSMLDGSLEAQELSYGVAALPRPRFDKADLVVSLGADFLGTWGNPVEQSEAWSRKRKLDSSSSARATMSKLVSFEAGMSLTGANSDERYPIRPGDEARIAMALLHELVIAQKRTRFAGNAALSRALAAFSIEKTAQAIGGSVTKAALTRLVEELWFHRGRSIVVTGGFPAQSADSISLQVAVNLLNSALGNEGETIEASSGAGRPMGFGALRALVSELRSGSVDLLIVHRANPVYDLPAELDFAGAMGKAKMLVVSGDRLDETARLADFAAPDHHFLENWGDANPEAGLYSLQQPTVAPLFATRGFQDSLLAWMAGAGRSGRSYASATDWHGYLKAHWQAALHPSFGKGQSFEEFWESSLRKGVVGTRAPARAARAFRDSAIDAIRVAGAPEGQVLLGAYEKIGLGDGRSAGNAWLQEMPDPISTVAWDNYLNIGPTLAKEMALETNDVVSVSAGGDHALEVPVFVQPGIHPRAATLAVGYGRESAGPVGTQVGVNALRLARVTSAGHAISGLPVTLAKTGKRYPLASTQGHHRTEGRPIVNDVTLQEFRKNPRVENHTDPHLRMKVVPTIWSKHDYSKGYRWGMAIDLSACSGCGACVIACQAENNIPVVGRDRVRMGREMHWIRIDRYYSGPAENPDTVFQPMLCQHCENAPCETVCPVLATVHNEEGLNEMVYNRCVGTRYCQNNCPYKVRRFNFFDHWKDYKDEANLVWNPDVTVRSRGVMEKCTFCVQRIQEARSKSKDEKRAIRDADVVPACAQTCASDAIVFGNLNDPESRVSRLHRDARAFRVLELLNTKPMISYLTKVRNKDEVHPHGHS